MKMIKSVSIYNPVLHSKKHDERVEKQDDIVLPQGSMLDDVHHILRPWQSPDLYLVGHLSEI